MLKERSFVTSRQWLQTDLVGLVQGDGVAFSHPRIAPAIVNHTDLRHASGVFQTMRGEIRVSWSYNHASRRVALNVTLPLNVVGEVIVPCVTAAVSTHHPSPPRLDFQGMDVSETLLVFAGCRGR